MCVRHAFLLAIWLTNVHAKSLRTFIGKHQELKGLRLSMMSYQDQGWMENRPLYAVGDWV